MTRATVPVVVVGVDGSPGGEDALDWAAAYARATGGSLRLVSAWDWPTFEGAPIVLGDYDPRKAAADLLKHAATRVKFPPERIATSVLRGLPARALLDAAHDADLLVVGSRGLGGFSGLVLGSVGSYCAHHAPCPVVVVRRAASEVAARAS
jgi:nucleotide-binding universal stress UspA family protein